MQHLKTVWLLLIHLGLLLVILKPDAPTRLYQTMGMTTNQPELTPHFFTMRTFHRRIDQNLPKGTVYFLGDSHIQGMAVAAVHPTSVNLGIGSDTTLGLLTRLPDYHSMTNAGGIILCIGHNDLKRRSNGEILDNYRKILQQLPVDVPTWINAIFPINEVAAGRKGHNQRVRQLNRLLQAEVQGLPNAHWIDISSQLMDEEGNLAAAFHQGDGIHLSQAGYEIWIRVLKSYLNQHKDGINRSHHG